MTTTTNDDGTTTIVVTNEQAEIINSMVSVCGAIAQAPGAIEEAPELAPMLQKLLVETFLGLVEMWTSVLDNDGWRDLADALGFVSNEELRAIFSGSTPGVADATDGGTPADGTDGGTPDVAGDDTGAAAGSGATV